MQRSPTLFEETSSMPVGCWRTKSACNFYLHQTRTRTPFSIKPQTSTSIKNEMPTPVSARSEASVCGLSLTDGMIICLLSDKGLCVRLITPPEESYRVWCFWVWSRSPDIEEALVSRQFERRVEMKWQNWIKQYTLRHYI